MADLGNVLSAATEYGNAREAEGRAEEREQAAADIAAANARALTAENAYAELSVVANELRAERDDAEVARINAVADLQELQDEFAEHMRTVHGEPDPEPAVCPPGTDRAGQVIPDGETEAWCTLPDPDPEPEPRKVLIGMSAPADEWGQRISEVGANGVTARRIFADLAKGGNDKQSTIAEAHADGMVPVVSYKVGGNITGALNGQYDTQARAAATMLRSFGKLTAVTFWHEPNPDITGAQFRALHKRYLTIFQSENIKVGPILNGWLLDRQRPTFEQYIDDELLTGWDYVGMDVYQGGTLTNPGPPYPHQRLAPLLDVLADRGHPDKPLVIGEYNGWEASTIRDSGEAWLSCPSMWIALLFNSANGAKGHILTGPEIDAFKATKSDPRAQQ